MTEEFTRTTDIDAIKSLNLKGTPRVMHIDVEDDSSVIINYVNMRRLEKDLLKAKNCPEIIKIKFFLVTAKTVIPEKAKCSMDGLYRVETDDSIKLYGKPFLSEVKKNFDVDVHVAELGNQNLVKTLSSLKLDLIVLMNSSDNQALLPLLLEVTNDNGKVPLISKMMALKTETTTDYTTQPVGPLIGYMKKWTNHLPKPSTLHSIIEAHDNYRLPDDDQRKTPVQPKQIYCTYYNGFPDFFEK